MKRAMAIAVLLFLAGCAGQTQLVSDPERKKVSVVSISPTVAKPANIYYLGPGNAPAFMFGAIGGAIAAPVLERERQQFQSESSKTGVSIQEIVREEVDAAVRKSGKLAVSESPAPGGATMTVSILQYGFSVPNGFSSKLVPILYIKCELTDAAGKMLWSATDRVLTLGNPVEPVTPEELRDPKVAERQWRLAARHLATSLMGTY